MKRFFLGFFAVTTFPVWMLPIAFVPVYGFNLYLAASSFYFQIPGSWLNSRWIESHEFGWVPTDTKGYLISFIFYGLIYTLIYVLAKLIIAMKENKDFR